MEENGATTAGVITIEVGTLAGVDKSSLEFSFEAITRGTPLEHARLNVEDIKPKARCRRCSGEYEARPDNFKCPTCGAGDFDIVAGMEIFVRDVEVE
jgi:hydrogenase nickel incorporation protein HypA/HybF